MPITHRQYAGPDDYRRIGEFLIRHYQEDNQDGNWFQPTWEYMDSLSFPDKTALDKIRIWEDADEIVAVVHFESRLGEVFFQLHPDHHNLKREMLDYAEMYLLGSISDDRLVIQAYVNDFDDTLRNLVMKRGYTLKMDWSRPVSQFVIPDRFLPIHVPDGFVLKSLAEDNNLIKLDRVLHRGFNHEGEPDGSGIEGRKIAQSTPNYDKNLKIVVQAPDGYFVSFCGMWYEPVNKIAYVEPVATDPEYRRKGLGRAAVWEGIRRCGLMGAKVAYVGSDLEFYKAIGFKVIYTSQCWVKYFPKDVTRMCPEAYT
jgi:predicted N-acetyltransferase YhbS